MDGEEETPPDWVHVKVRGSVGAWLKVQIAAHPEWGYDNLPDLFTKTATREVRTLLAGPSPTFVPAVAPTSPEAASATVPEGPAGFDSRRADSPGPPADRVAPVPAVRGEHDEAPEAAAGEEWQPLPNEARPPSAAARDGASAKKARRAKAAPPAPPAPAPVSVEFSLGPDDLKDIKDRFVKSKLAHPAELASNLGRSGGVRKLYYAWLREILGANPKWAPMLEGPQVVTDLRVQELLEDYVLASKHREYRVSLSAMSKEVAA